MYRIKVTGCAAVLVLIFRTHIAHFSSSILALARVVTDDLARLNLQHRELEAVRRVEIRECTVSISLPSLARRLSTTVTHPRDTNKV